MIIYRPHRGGLAESLSEAQMFTDTASLKKYILDKWNGMLGFSLFDEQDIVLNEDKPGYADERCGWMDVRHVCVKRMNDVVYAAPQCIGMWATVFPGNDNAAEQ